MRSERSSVGKRADFALWRIERPAELAYNLGANPCEGVVFGGRVRQPITPAPKASAPAV